jgi:hypothetical protein
MGTPIGLDYGAVMAVATARRADVDLLSEVLPAVEAAILDNLAGDGDDESIGSEVDGES